MPLLVNKYVGTNSRLALWDITESCDELLKELNCVIDPLILNVNDQLKKQRIAARILCNLLTDGLYKEISYDSFNKPYFAGSDIKLSISHAHERVAVITNKVNETGIDIELIKPKVERIAARFLNEAELQQLQTNDRIEQLTTYWCAKEALYKYYGRKELLFRENIFVDQFEQNTSGNFNGHIHTAHFDIKLNLCYEKINDYMLVYVND